ncbi:MAG: hypothetical protein DRP96_11535 [Candidatus Neomarinimicrobiota bacterium]|nr:MAG: hypothetical protein DRP96_11535 [Candidatus Neomarinimicrobiota bacterium]
MNKAYFVTCGTSTFNKYCRNIAGGDCKSLDEFASRIGIPAATEGSALGTTIAEKIADKISRLDEKKIATVSAELNTLFSIRGEHELEKNDNILLFSTGAWEAMLSAEIVEQVLLSKGYANTSLIVTKEIVKGKRDFELGLPALVRNMMEKYREFSDMHNMEVIFVVTGGYKAMTAVTAALGMLLEKRCYYLFEGSNDTVDVGILPVAIRSSAVPKGVYEAIRMGGAFRRSELKNKLHLSPADIGMYMVKDEDGNYRPSAMGSLLDCVGETIPACVPEVPIEVSEAGKEHSYPEWGAIKKADDIKDNRVLELLRSVSRALHGYAEVIHIGEFEGAHGDGYGIRYAGERDGVVRLALVTPPMRKVFLSVRPAPNVKLDELGELCRDLWKR